MSHDTGTLTFANRWRSVLRVPSDELTDRWLDSVDGWEVEQVDEGVVYFLPKKNLVVNTGVNRSLDRLFAISGPPGAVITMGVDDGASNPVAGTTDSTSGSTNRRLVSFDSTPTRSSQTVSASGTFTQATVSFVMKRLFLSAAAAGTTDSSGDLVAMTNVFTMDLTSFSSWSQTFTAEYTGSGS